ncbi:stabilizer of axonemal microtubules 2-like [Scyliorhinus canicula]|uniref:stabilizer of axonemal microtubules 2-like n=1 Tax=Scyliorhinus canicula TaxID=7830 RepID=UPI0018F448B8|nr:stabilizer of axonemal microtubules 2-like [Scyliorhinus canicula]
MKRKCICELCTCGRHRCPHLPTAIFEKINKPCLITEYVEKYAPYNDVQPRDSYKPRENYQRHQGQMQSVTTFRADYTPHDIQPRPGKVSEEYRQPPGAMNLDTTYKRDYNLHSVQPVLPARPPEQKTISAPKMETIPTYKDHYKQWELTKRESSKPEYTFKIPSIKFANRTTFQDDYSFKIPEPKESFKPPNAARLLNMPFDDMTNYRQHYIPYTQEPRKRRECVQYKPSDEPFDDLTTHRRDFKGQAGELVLPIRPPGRNLNPNGQFYDLTEFRDKYRSWNMDPPAVHKAVEFVVPEGKMNLSTTTHTDYVEHKLQPSVPARPMPQMSEHRISFEGQSTMKADYKPWGSTREPMIKPREELDKPTGQFDDMTTFRAHYVPHPANLVHSFKPRNTYIPNTTPLDNGTTYQYSFTPKAVEVCIASFAVPPGYEYVETDPRGHKLYRRVSERENIQPRLSNSSMDLISNIHSHQKVTNDLKTGFPTDGIVAG